MSSAAQFAANRANSQLSTGPRTAEGKARSSQNARKEGFSAQTLRIPADQQVGFDDYRREVLHDTRPDGAVEREYADRILLYGWNLRRVRAAEAELLAGSDYVEDEVDGARLHRLARYRRDLERSYDRALAELRRLQTQRAVLLQQHDRLVHAFLDRTPMAELSAITRHTDTVIDRSTHPLIHRGRRLSGILRADPRQEATQKEAAAEPILDPEVAQAMTSSMLTDADKHVCAALLEEIA
jgi:hypothetical protein